MGSRSGDRARRRGDRQRAKAGALPMCGTMASPGASPPAAPTPRKAAATPPSVEPRNLSTAFFGSPLDDERSEDSIIESIFRKHAEARNADSGDMPTVEKPRRPSSSSSSRDEDADVGPSAALVKRAARALPTPAPGRGRPPSPRARSALGTSAKAKPNPAAAPAPASADGAEAGTPDPGFRSPASKLIPNPFPAHHFEQISRAVRVKVLDLDRRVRSVEKLAKIRNHAQDIAALMRADEVASVGAVAMADASEVRTILAKIDAMDVRLRALDDAVLRRGPWWGMGGASPRRMSQSRGHKGGTTAAILSGAMALAVRLVVALALLAVAAVGIMSAGQGTCSANVNPT